MLHILCFFHTPPLFSWIWYSSRLQCIYADFLGTGQRTNTTGYKNITDQAEHYMKARPLYGAP